MKKAIIITVAIFLFYGGLSAYVISAQGIEELLICADTGGLKIPFSKYLCKKYLFIFRGSPDDINTLQQGTGASFVVRGQSSLSERKEILGFLISRGLDINQLDKDQLTPLHGAVLDNDPDEVKILLDKGANPLLKDGRFKLTPLELALKLQGENKIPTHRDSVISLLKNANSNTPTVIPGDHP